MNNPWEELKGAPTTTEQSASASQNVVAHSSIVQNPIAQTPVAQTPVAQTPVARKVAGNRGGAFFLFAVGAGITIFDWYIRNTQQVYSVKMAVVGPICAVLGIAGLIFPQSLEKTSEDAVGKIARVAAIVLGIAAGGLNWYLLAN